MVQEDYHSQNPYHNAVHAADVTQAMHCYLKEPKVAVSFISELFKWVMVTVLLIMKLPLHAACCFVLVLGVSSVCLHRVGCINYLNLPEGLGCFSLDRSSPCHRSHVVWVPAVFI